MEDKLTRERRFHGLLDELLELPSAERSAWLDERCGGEPALRRRLEQALAFEDDHVDDLLKHPKSAARTAAAGPLEEAMFSGTAFLSGPVPRIIGQYVLYEILGQGGMGRVFRSEQLEPVRREVALKLMRSSVKTPETRARFDAERRTLERLEHVCKRKAVLEQSFGGDDDVVAKLSEALKRDVRRLAELGHVCEQ